MRRLSRALAFYLISLIIFTQPTLCFHWLLLDDHEHQSAERRADHPERHAEECAPGHNDLENAGKPIPVAFVLIVSLTRVPRGIWSSLTELGFEVYTWAHPPPLPPPRLLHA